MSSKNEFPKLALKKYAPIQERESSESKYWRQFKVSHEEVMYGAPSCIHFASSLFGDQGSENKRKLNSLRFLVTSSTKISLFDAQTDKIVRSFSRFSDEAYCGKFRKDGKLLVAGDKAGYIKVFDIKTKAALRQIKGHNLATRSCDWSLNGLQMISGSDDYSVKRWDLATEECLFDSSRNSHGDYVRVVESHPSMNEVFYSGSYDHNIRLWDSRSGQCSLVMNHGAPIDCALINRSGSLLISGGGPEIKIWDLVAGGRLIHTFSSHQKNVTGLAFDGVGGKLLSCSLDGHIKVHSMQSFQVLHGLKIGSPLVSIAVSPDDRKLVMGHADGNLTIRTNKQDAGDSEENEIVPGRLGRVMNNENSQRVEGLLETERQVKLRPYEQHLKRFNYHQALDAALKTRNPTVVVTVLEELCRRSGLTIALSGRDDASLEPLLSFAAKHISHPRYCRLITQVVDRILDIYGEMLGQSDVLDELFVKLYSHLKAEVGFQRQVMKVLGALDGVINSSSLSNTN